jgi:hypothetical protein
MDSAYAWLIGFVFAQLVLTVTALLPWRFWRSEFGQVNNRKEKKRRLIAVEDSEA